MMIVKNKKYGQSRLSEWLSLESWSNKDGLCILAGIDPLGAVIECDGFTNVHGGRVDLPVIRSAQLFMEGRDHSYEIDPELEFEIKSEYPEPSPFIKAEDFAAMPGHESDPEQFSNRLAARTRLEKLWRLFFGDQQHEIKQRHEPRYFIDWARTNNVEIDWLTWAIENDLLKDKMASKTLDITDERERTTYLNIIGALLEILFGESSTGKRNSVFRNQTDVINALIEKHSDKQGISKRTLEGKFSAAKNSINQI